MGSNTSLKIKKYIKRRLKNEIKKFQHTIFMKFDRPLAIILHYIVHFNLECYKSSVSDMGSNTTLKIKKYIKRRLKSEIKKFQHTIFMKFDRPLAIIAHYTIQFNLGCCKSSVSDMGPNTILNFFKLS